MSVAFWEGELYIKVFVFVSRKSEKELTQSKVKQRKKNKSRIYQTSL